MEVGEFKRRQKTFDNDVCAVKSCRNKPTRDLTVSFRLKARKIGLKIANISTRTKVCSLHFQTNNYLFADAKAKRRFLKKDAVPSCNLPDSRIEKKVKNDDRLEMGLLKRDTANKMQQMTKKELLQEVKCEESDNVDAQENENNFEENIDIVEHVPVKCEIIELQDQNNYENVENSKEVDAYQQFLKEMYEKAPSPEPVLKDIGVQVDTNVFIPSIMKIINSDSSLSTATGLESFELVNDIVKIVIKICGDKYEQYNMIMNTRDRIIMTYMKLKQNISYSFLAILFECNTAKHCQQIFCETIQILINCSKQKIPLPLKEKISKYLPKFDAFKDSHDFEKV